MTTWPEHVQRWCNCQRCPLAQQRSNICLARGTIPCEILFIGEAPGVSEDAFGIPFIGPAGHLLDQIIEKALPNTATYALTNLVACYPRIAKEAGINEPERGEIMECQPRLVEFVNIARPRLIICVGSLATQYVRHGDTIPCVDIIHPAYILARLPAAQKGFVINKCIVQIRNAYEDAIQTNQQFKTWGQNNAEAKTKRQQLRTIYEQADEEPPY